MVYAGMEYDQEAEKIVRRMIDDNVEPDAEFLADAGQEYGVAEAWKVGNRYAVKYGDDARTYYDYADDADDLAAWLEWDGLDELEAIEQKATIRGADAVPEASEKDKGPFYILITRYWYGPRRSHSLSQAFESYAEAAKAVEALDQEVYVCAHNESGRPSYKIVAA